MSLGRRNSGICPNFGNFKNSRVREREGRTETLKNFGVHPDLGALKNSIKKESRTTDIQKIYTVNVNSDEFSYFLSECLQLSFEPIYRLTLLRIWIDKWYFNWVLACLSKQDTKFINVFPSCLRFEYVSQMCDGSLITMEPTPTVYKNFPQMQSTTRTYEIDEVTNDLEIRDNSNSVWSSEISSTSRATTQQLK